MPVAAEQGWYPLTSSIWESTSGPRSGSIDTKPGGSEEMRPAPPAPPAPPASPPPALPARPPSSPDTSEIRVGKNGRIQGVDGMLDQVAQAMARHAGPMLVRDVLPAVQQDEAMQVRVGQAAGNAMATNLRPWIILGVGALAVLAAVEVMRFRAQRAQRAGR